ncbi:MAG: tetratricopeptide repeat protein [Pseudomonadota bacterium]
MANEDSLFLKEVDQALDEDRQWAFFRQYGAALIAGAVIVVGGVAGWQIWDYTRIQAAQEQALEFRNALELHEQERDAGRSALEALAEDKGGYATLAAFRLANSYAAGGERLRALEVYRAVAQGDAPRRIREFAQLRAAYLSLADGRDAVMADLGNLTEGDGPYSYYAKEVLGLASLSAEDYESATATFNELSLDLNAPEGIRDRATEFGQLAEQGRAGVNISGEARVEDLLEAVGAPSDPGALEDALLGNVPVDRTPLDDADAAANGEESAQAQGDEINGATSAQNDETAEDENAGHNHEE